MDGRQRPRRRRSRTRALKWPNIPLGTTGKLIDRGSSLRHADARQVSPCLLRCKWRRSVRDREVRPRDKIHRAPSYFDPRRPNGRSPEPRHVRVVPVRVVLHVRLEWLARLLIRDPSSRSRFRVSGRCRAPPDRAPDVSGISMPAPDMAVPWPEWQRRDCRVLWASRSVDNDPAVRRCLDAGESVDGKLGCLSDAMRTPANGLPVSLSLTMPITGLVGAAAWVKRASVIEGDSPVGATSSVIDPELRNRSRQDADLLELDRRARNLEPNQSLATDPLDRETSLGVGGQLKRQSRTARGMSLRFRYSRSSSYESRTRRCGGDPGGQVTLLGSRISWDESSRRPPAGPRDRRCVPRSAHRPGQAEWSNRED